MKGYFITEEQMKAAADYLEELYSLSEDKLQPLGEREIYFRQWQGARRLMRRFGYRLTDIEEMMKGETA